MLRRSLTVAVALAVAWAASYAIPVPAIEVAMPPGLQAEADALVPQPPRRFATDGCSGGFSWAWRIVFREPPRFEGCCVRHDREYWADGPGRAGADERLQACVAATGYPATGFVMRAAVRVGGWSCWPRSYRWGYGYPWPQGCVVRSSW